MCSRFSLIFFYLSMQKAVSIREMQWETQLSYKEMCKIVVLPFSYFKAFL